MNDPGLITRDYAYWVENRLRDRFALAGIPVVIDFVRRAHLNVGRHRRWVRGASVFSTLLRARGHDVTLACRDPEQVARSPRRAQPALPTDVDLSGVAVTTVPQRLWSRPIWSRSPSRAALSPR